MSALSKEVAPAVAPPTPNKQTSGPASQRGRIREVDGYRALAALMVIVFHTWTVGNYPYQGSLFATAVNSTQFAVSLFFALSGFVTFLPMVRGALSGEAPSGRKFFVRRLYRILPVYLVVVLLTWSSRFAGTPTDFWVLLEHLTFTQVYDKHHIFWLSGPSWYLADEMHFYVLIALVAPPLALLAARRKTVAARLTLMAAFPIALLLGSLAYTTVAAYGFHVPWRDSWVYFNPLPRVDSFAEGMLLAVALSIPGVQGRPRPRLALIFSGIPVLVLLWFIGSGLPAIGIYYFGIAGLGCVLVLAGATMLHERQRLSRVLRWRPLSFWATIGFSLFLWHEPVMIQLARWHILNFYDPVAWPISTVGLITASTIVAWLSYKLIERPGSQLHKLFGELRLRQAREPASGSEPPPRWLPDLTLRTARGAPIALRDLLRDRPVLLALDHDRGRALDEQRFRIDAGEADAFYVVSEPDQPAPSGTTVLVDSGSRFAGALGRPAGVIEVSPGGQITAMFEPRSGTVVPGL